MATPILPQATVDPLTASIMLVREVFDRMDVKVDFPKYGELSILKRSENGYRLYPGSATMDGHMSEVAFWLRREFRFHLGVDILEMEIRLVINERRRNNR